METVATTNPISKSYKRQKNIPKRSANNVSHGSASSGLESSVYSTPTRHTLSDQSVRVNVLNESSHTPMPNFDAMDDAEIKAQLDRVGMRPICRVKAIRMLKRIYEAVHPVTEVGAGTPLTQRVSRALLRTQKRPLDAERAEKAREKRIRKALSKAAPMTMPIDGLVSTSDDAPTLSSAVSATHLVGVAATSSLTAVIESYSDEWLTTSGGGAAVGSFSSSSLHSTDDATIANGQVPPKRDQDYLIRTFLEWLRTPANEDLYYELLTLNPVLFERLAVGFGEELRAQRISRIKFADILDRLHVTYCVPQHDNGHY